MNEKLTLIKDNNPLSLYCFTIQSGPMLLLDIPMESQLIVAYNEKEAVELVNKTYHTRTLIRTILRSKIEINKLFEKIALQEIPAASIIDKFEEPKETTAQKFVYGLMFVIDKYIKDETDKNTIKEIIKKIKV